MYATLLQVAGLIGVVVAAALEFGLTGCLAAGSVVAVYVGLAAERT